MLGAIAVEISGAVGEGEEIADMATYLGNWFDAIVVRPPSFRSLAVLAEATPAMVVNARTRLNHPCEILGDLAAVHASGHDITDTTNVVFVGEATDLCYSWLEAAAVLALALTQVCPPGFQADIEAWQQLTRSPAGTVQVAHDFEDVLQQADVVYTDCWPTGLDSEAAQEFRNLQITADVLDRCSSNVMFLPCPPVSRGEEVSSDAMTHPSCRVIEAKQWLLHAQNALLVSGLNGS